MGAVFSPCRRWRYSLTRAAAADGDGTVVFVGLNPSRADESTDDPTTRRCLGFARDWGFASLELVNLFAYAATEPAVLQSVSDRAGPGNTEAVVAALNGCDLVVCAWGNDGLGPEADAVLELASEPYCLGTTLRGAPRHPLYVRATTHPRPFDHRPEGASRGEHR
jgi:hypothetical protein